MGFQKPSRIPTPEKALEIISPLSPEIYRAFEHGGQKAREYFERESVEYDGSAYATIVRLHAKDYLKNHPEFAKVVFDALSMCGISFLFRNWKFRLWKSADRRAPKLPRPDSAQKQLYYVQPAQLELFAHKKKKKAGAHVHFVILWNLDGKGNLETLWLVCPKDFNPQTGEIKVHWIVEITNPIAGIQQATPPSPAPALPLEPRKTPATKEA